MTLSKPPIVLGIFVVLLSCVLCLLALHPTKQEAPEKKESSRAHKEHPPRDNLLPTEPESIAIPPKLSPIAEATTEKKEMARAQQLLASTNEKHRIEGLKLLGAFPNPMN